MRGRKSDGNSNTNRPTAPKNVDFGVTRRKFRACANSSALKLFAHLFTAPERGDANRRTLLLLQFWEREPGREQEGNNCYKKVRIYMICLRSAFCQFFLLSRGSLSSTSLFLFFSSYFSRYDDPRAQIHQHLAGETNRVLCPE